MNFVAAVIATPNTLGGQVNGDVIAVEVFRNEVPLCGDVILVQLADQLGVGQDELIGRDDAEGEGDIAPAEELHTTAKGIELLHIVRQLVVGGPGKPGSRQDDTVWVMADVLQNLVEFAHSLSLGGQLSHI